MSKMMSSPSDSSSEDECNIYVNAAFKLNALNNQKRSNTRNKINLDDDVVNTCKTKSAVKALSRRHKPIEIDESSEEEPVICIDDIDDTASVVINELTPKRITRSSRKRNATVSERLHYTKCFNDSIEEELNMSANDSFDLSQEDYDNCIMIGSPEIKRSNSDNTQVTIKILWRSDQCQRFELGKRETFQTIFKSLAKLEGISEDQILITKKDRRITPFDTPASINWCILDILDGGVVSAELVKKHKKNSGQDDTSESGCKLKIQTSDKRVLTLSLKHDETFATLLKACSEQLNIPESKIKFYFDGELINVDETPDILDLEDEACIDCKISK